MIDFPSTSVGGRTVHFFVWRRAALLAAAAVVASAGCCVTSVGIARAAEATDICLALAKNVQSDVNIQGSIQQKFFQMQHLVGADIYASYSAAKDTKINADGDIAAYVDFVLETTSSDSDWAENRKSFLGVDYERIATNAAIKAYIDRQSEGITKSIIGCAGVIAEQQGFFAKLSSVSPNRDSFTISLQKKGGASDPLKIRGLSVTPNDPSFACPPDDYQKATPENPKVLQGAYNLITCQKDPNRHLSLSIDTDVGPAGPFQLMSQKEELNAIRERIGILETSLEHVTDQLEALKETAENNSRAIDEHLAAVTKSINSLGESLNAKADFNKGVVIGLHSRSECLAIGIIGLVRHQPCSDSSTPTWEIRPAP
jgi:hypothetical protein